MVNQTENKGIHIRTLQASKAFEHSERGEYVKAEYTGMMPYSLLTIKLDNTSGFKKRMVVSEGTKKNPIKYKYLTDDLINIKFDHKALKLEEIVNQLKNDIKSIEKRIANTTDEKKLSKLNKILEIKNIRYEEIKDIDVSKNKAWEEKPTGFLRSHLYEKGFTFNGVKYVQFMRSSSKSREGQCLFIKKSLHNSIQKWTRLGYEIKKDEPVDLVSLRAYESLCSSEVEFTIDIDVESIFIIEDLVSKFKVKDEIKVVKVNDAGKLEVIKEKDVEMKNDIWDGQSLMDYETFFEGKDYSFMLLRNHMFKSAGFAFDIQGYLKDYHKLHKPTQHYDDWELIDMFKNPMLAKNIKVVTTPNSCKFLKFAYLTTKHSIKDYAKLSDLKKNNAENNMFKKWKEKVIKDGEVFGVCKHEKASTHGFYDENEPNVHRLSYQVVNTLPADKTSISILMKDEKEYVKSLQNNTNNAFINYLTKTSNDLNANDLYVGLFNMNNDFQYTRMYKDFKSTKINDYKGTLKRGNIRVKDIEYAIMCSNPLEMMQAVVKKITPETLKPVALKGDQIYTKLFNFGVNVVGWRNPHTATSNYYKSRNTTHPLIENYMKHISKNVVIVNSIETILAEILSGADFDSDSQVLSINDCIRYTTKNIKEEHLPVVSGIKPEKSNTYTYSDAKMAEADEKIARSSKTIGMVANLGQLAVSIANNLKSKGEHEKAEKVNNIVSIVCALSTVCIDVAKKSFGVKIESEISSIRKVLNTYIQDRYEYMDGDVKKVVVTAINKPMFFKEIEKKKNENDEKLKKVRKIPVNYVEFNTPMDYLQKELKMIGSAKTTKTIALKELLNPELKLNDSNNHQIKRLAEMVKELESDFIQIKKDTPKEEIAERLMKASDLKSKYTEELSKMEIHAPTIKSFINRMCIVDDESEISIKENSNILNLLLYTKTEEFCKVFLQKS